MRRRSVPSSRDNRADCEGLPDPSGATKLYVQRQYFRGTKRTVESALGGILGPFRTPHGSR